MKSAGALQVGLLSSLLSILSVMSSASAASREPLTVQNEVQQSAVRLVEGDILTSASPMGNEAPSTMWRAMALASDLRLWPDGIVPFDLHDDLPATSIRAIREAVDHWNRVGSITLRDLNDWPEALPRPSDSVLFQPGESCASWVGRRGGVQEVWVAPNCNAGSMLHEIGHLLGLEHEHTRPDRDQYIRIHWDNIDPEKHHNFDAAPAGSRMLGDYDLGSIMHYGLMNFSANGRPTLSALAATDVTIGQRIAPSEGDLAAVASLYATDLSIATQVSTDREDPEIVAHVSNNGSQGAHDIRVQVVFGDNRLKGWIGDGWQCLQAPAGSLICTLARLPGNTRQSLTLLPDVAVAASDVTATVTAKTPDAAPYNNADGIDVEPTLGEANALEDPFSPLSGKSAQSASGASYGALLLLFSTLLHRLARFRIDRQTGDRIEGIG